MQILSRQRAVLEIDTGDMCQYERESEEMFLHRTKSVLKKVDVNLLRLIDDASVTADFASRVFFSSETAFNLAGRLVTLARIPEDLTGSS